MLRLGRYARFIVFLFFVAEPLFVVFLYNVVGDSYHYEAYEYSARYINFVGLRSKNATYDFVKFVPYELENHSFSLRNITIAPIYGPSRVDIRICFNTLFVDKNLGKILIRVDDASIMARGLDTSPNMFNVTIIVGSHVSGYFFVDGQTIFFGQAAYGSPLEIFVDDYDSQKIYAHDYLAVDLSLPPETAEIVYMTISVVLYRKYLVLGKSTKMLSLAILLSGFNILMFVILREKFEYNYSQHKENT